MQKYKFKYEQFYEVRVNGRLYNEYKDINRTADVYHELSIIYHDAKVEIVPRKRKVRYTL